MEFEPLHAPLLNALFAVFQCTGSPGVDGGQRYKSVRMLFYKVSVNFVAFEYVDGGIADFRTEIGAEDHGFVDASVIHDSHVFGTVRILSALDNLVISILYGHI